VVDEVLLVKHSLLAQAVDRRFRPPDESGAVLPCPW